MTFEEWKLRALEADILSEAVARGAVLRRAGREHIGPCPACGGKDRFSINPAKRIFNCRGAVGGDVVGLVMHVDGVSFMQAVEALTGEPPPNGKSKPLSDAEIDARNRRIKAAEAERLKRDSDLAAYQDDTREAAARVWDESHDLTGTVAAAYLNNRGIPMPETGWPLVLRCHPALPYPGRGRMPALVCRVDDVCGDLTAVWRIYLNVDGTAKALVDNPKLGLGPAGGGAVRIGLPNSGLIGPKLGIAEGVETALGAWNLIGRKYPVWAALSTSGLIGVELPLAVRSLTIFPDGDSPIRRFGEEYAPAVPPGRAAANNLKTRVLAEGLACCVAAEPGAGLDYLDLWNAKQREAA